MVIFTLMLLDVESESENWNFLKYGRIGNTLCNPYIQGTTVPCDTNVLCERLIYA